MHAGLEEKLHGVPPFTVGCRPGCPTTMMRQGRERVTLIEVYDHPKILRPRAKPPPPSIIPRVAIITILTWVGTPGVAIFERAFWDGEVVNF
jgi:hypothetical protein